jgi:LysM repeat protein
VRRRVWAGTLLALLAGLLLPLAGAVEAQGPVHVVQAGENLFRIALRYGTTVDALMETNDLDDIYIRAGQELLIPATAEAPPPEEDESSYLVRSGDTLITVALRRDTTTWALAEENGLSAFILYPGQSLVAPLPEVAATAETAPLPPPPPEPEAAPAKPDSYVVRPGDTLYSIATRHGMAPAALARLNGISNPASIRVGQALRFAGMPPAIPEGRGKRVVISLSEQHLYAYEDDRLVHSFVVSSGAPPHYTRTGRFTIQSKVPNAYGSAWDIWMPYWLGIYWAGSTENGIHALPVTQNGQTLWAGHLGTPVSYGCIVLDTYEARLLYEWAPVGTPVHITY